MSYNNGAEMPKIIIIRREVQICLVNIVVLKIHYIAQSGLVRDVVWRP